MLTARCRASELTAWSRGRREASCVSPTGMLSPPSGSLIQPICRSTCALSSGSGLFKQLSDPDRLSGSNFRCPRLSVFQRCSSNGDHVSTYSLAALFQRDLRPEKRAAVRHLVGG